ncbi:16S rRNA (guanine(966)-N(2))-methyltransferase RsmD [Acidipila sp. EB88]|uniref:16S rRNA (guanine(966)-N(2))-methyltransferase RsmD n=1 Tax=Acidipila sp. EB88 TaxID=2305226 RepID=UPI000F5FE6C1|nr:16S rRNA (guanine(966)-N(2))-methyltransferase RsmD [Acidipila sp. EB88]RRA48548.1 16S rRNA (guanine(966)-N(2))-methyltransferase RsmD [Acidipila sp. EB88]
MRIIAGEFRSRILETPRGMATRPTTDRLRETLFNVLQPRLHGAHFLDLYAGSGANGLEAVSRGAAEAVCVEQATAALSAIRRNVEVLGVRSRVRVEGLSVQRWLAQAVRTAASASASTGAAEGVVAPSGFDIVFLDPPYDDNEAYAATLGLLGTGAAALLAPGALVVAEHARSRSSGRARAAAASPTPATALAERYGSLQRTRVLEQGDAVLSFYAAARAEHSES